MRTGPEAAGESGAAGGSRGFHLALRLGLLLARILPPAIVIRGAAALFAAGGKVSSGRRAVEANLRAIEEFRGVRLGEEGRTVSAEEGRKVSAGVGRRVSAGEGRRAAASAVYRSYGRYWGEFLVLAARPGLFSRFSIRPEGLEHLEEAARRGAVCVLTGHLGNWDLGARWLGRFLPDLAVAAEELRPPALFELFRRIREKAGARVIPAPRGAAELFRHLRGGGHAALVADRVFGTGRARVPFLGGFRTFPSGGILLARRAGASLLPAFLRREGAGFVVRFHPDVSRSDDPVGDFARALESEILERPEQWCILEPVHDPSPESPDLLHQE